MCILRRGRNRTATQNGISKDPKNHRLESYRTSRSYRTTVVDLSVVYRKQSRRLKLYNG